MGGGDVKTCSKRPTRPTGWGDRDRIFDRGPVKSNLISQELLQDLPRGESRIQLLPDKDHGRIGVTMSVSSTRRTEELQYRWTWRPATTPMRYSHEFSLSSFEIRKSKASHTAVEAGGEFICYIFLTTNTAEIRVG